MDLLLGSISRCMLAVLPCDVIQLSGPTLEPEIYAVCPYVDYETTQTSTPWRDDIHLRRMVIKEKDHTVILYIGCPKKGV